MRRPPVAALLLAVVLTASLAACTPEPPTPTATPEPTATPLFATEEEALAAAENSFVRFQTVSDSILHEGGSRAERIEEVATGSLRSEEIASYREFESKGWHSTGDSELVAIVLQSFESAQHQTVVSTYVCVDVSAVDVVDSSGISVVSAARPDRQVFQIDFDAHGGLLLPSNSEPWDGDEVCDA